ncbi:MAG TPA: hypothetical protein VJ820_20875, partial [Propionibacteriaceae bacterium]|nr:hypothetical protein [Propionibacteriaceae bacterium]
NQPMRGSLYGAVVVDQGAMGESLNGPSPLGGNDTCDLVEHDPFGPWASATDSAQKCRHDTAHFEIYYTLNGTGSFAVDTISATPDDLSEDTFGPCVGRIDPDTCNGVPDYIDKVAQGLEEAFAIYSDPAQLNFPVPWSGRTPVIIRGNLEGGQVMPNFLNPLEDAETIEISLDDGAPYYLAHHELFHVFQYSTSTTRA